MSNYNIQISWSGKDALSDSDPAKVISGADFNTEFSAVQTAVNTKADINGNAGEDFAANGVTASTLTLGGTAITATAAELNILDGVTATATELNLLDGITDILDEDDFTSDSDTALATQQSIKAYVDTAVAGGATSTTFGAIGTYVFAFATSSSTVAPGSTVSGSNLLYGSSSSQGHIRRDTGDYVRAFHPASGSSLSGTWRNMGPGIHSNTIDSNNQSLNLYVRIS